MMIWPMTTIWSFFVCLIISGNSAYRKHARIGRETEVWYAMITVYVLVMSRNFEVWQVFWNFFVLGGRSIIVYFIVC